MSSRTNSPSSGKESMVGPVAAPKDVRASFVLWLTAIGATAGLKCAFQPVSLRARHLQSGMSDDFQVRFVWRFEYRPSGLADKPPGEAGGVLTC